MHPEVRCVQGDTECLAVTPSRGFLLTCVRNTRSRGASDVCDGRSSGITDCTKRSGESSWIVIWVVPGLGLEESEGKSLVVDVAVSQSLLVGSFSNVGRAEWLLPGEHARTTDQAQEPRREAGRLEREGNSGVHTTHPPTVPVLYLPSMAYETCLFSVSVPASLALIGELKPLPV
jgi:hypothetical protein